MFEQHPVPQNIASYQFRLVGDMTLTQFFQLAGGALIGLLFYSLPLPNIFKWPLIALSVIGGAAMAFLPIQERPLAMWIGAFTRSIYSPTFYIWQKLDSYQFFASEGTVPASQTPQDQNVQVQEGLINPSHVANLEEGEKTSLAKISRLFAFGTPKQTPQPQQPKQTTNNDDLATPLQQTEVVEIKQAPVKPQVMVPTQQAVKVEAKNPQPQEVTHQPIEVTEEKLGQTLTQDQNLQATQANFSVNAAAPSPPEKANVVVGQVMDNSGKIIEGAILEIKDEQGRPVRALKTNNVGHFLIVTPLNNGKYIIITEKEGYQFDNIEIEAKGEKIEPIAIRSK